ncbi:MAG: polyprenyl synthetase family protein [Gemmatimonadaceae bacterium]
MLLYRDEVERAVAALAADCDCLPAELQAPVAYSLGGGGKRLRGMLVIAAYRAAGGQGDASGLAAAVEVIHSYSLVHDDLPCMDDDDTRRGRPSTHRAFTVSSATTSGAAMIPLAAGVAYRSALALRLPASVCCTIVKVLMQGAGAGGMIGGQLMDLDAEGQSLDRDALDAIHAAKTGALIVASVEVGGLAAMARAEQVEALATYGRSIGLAFQIMDDVLDVTSSADALGKAVGRDAVLGKSTYPGLLGVDGATKRAARLVEDGCQALRNGGLLTIELESLAGYMVSRSH